MQEAAAQSERLDVRRLEELGERLEQQQRLERRQPIAHAGRAVADEQLHAPVGGRTGARQVGRVEEVRQVHSGRVRLHAVLAAGRVPVARRVVRVHEAELELRQLRHPSRHFRRRFLCRAGAGAGSCAGTAG